ncbi:ABC transporter permease [Chitinasiproducens palmae]|uniref:Putative spermidine/putrescine transport system permease protein n=1 Tax=Chitinasiproducens palmae TaxID=1770053 RepID=A0A1H2PPZ6_9BURK|nr:ABC transporter permease [Chitinasiproducens palmae]SDV48034.1 putative spermidine/putrescine transport system permease protein [Chitinasiproducens palmae]
MRRIPTFLLVFHLVFAVFMIAPLATVVLVSLTDKGYVAMPFDGMSLRWYRAILDAPDFIEAFWRSAGLATSAATLATLLAVPSGLAIAWYRFWGREAVMSLLLSPLMIPNVVLGIALLRFFTQINTPGSMWTLVLAHTLVVLPYALRLVVASAAGLDRSVGDAAQTLGASGWTAFRRVELPLIASGVAGGWLIAFITSFDELTMSIFVSSAATQTLPVRMYNYIANTIDPLLASVSTLLIVITLLLMLALDRMFGLDRVLSGKT